MTALDSKVDNQADWSNVDMQNDKVVTYRLWQHDLEGQGWLDWTHARQLVRLQRTVEDPVTGEVTIGQRYYVTHKTPHELSAKACGKISRAHWRCENDARPRAAFRQRRFAQPVISRGGGRSIPPLSPWCPCLLRFPGQRGQGWSVIEPVPSPRPDWSSHAGTSNGR